MGYEHDMEDYYDDQYTDDVAVRVGSIKFKRKNKISCNGVTFQSVVWNYICWILAGKPDDWRIDGA